MAFDGQASRHRRQDSRQRDASNLKGGVESQAPVGHMGIQTAWCVQRSGWRTRWSRMTIIGLTPSKRPCEKISNMFLDILALYRTIMKIDNLTETVPRRGIFVIPILVPTA